MTDTEWITDIPALEARYGDSPSAAISKVARRVTPLYRKWIMASRLCILSTMRAEGTDGREGGEDYDLEWPRRAAATLR